MRALDGYPLGGMLYAPHETQSPTHVALLHPGAGIRAVSYRGFASFLAQAGIPVLLYDYRGIGLSRPATLRGFDVTVEDWAEYDCTAAIGWLRERFPSAIMVGIAHSIGALVVGGASNAADQALIVMIGSHTAYYGDYALRYRAPMTALWHGFMPLVTRILGYFPARCLGLGADLPAGVALQWAKRRSPELVSATAEGNERTRKLVQRCAGLSRPALVVSITDDAFATPQGTARLLSYYRSLGPLRRVAFSPPEAATRRLGHFGLFRPRVGRMLWPRLLAEIKSQAPAAR